MALVEGSELLERYLVQVLEIPAGLEDIDGSSLTLALVVLRRRDGALLAVPMGVFASEVLERGFLAEEEDRIGQSLQLLVAAGTIEDFNLMEQPQPEEGESVGVLLVDVSAEIGDTLKPFDPAAHPLDLLHTFHADRPFLVPLAADLVRKAWEWVKDPVSGNLVVFYSADEAEAVPETPPEPARRGARPKAGVPNGGGGPGAGLSQTGSGYCGISSSVAGTSEQHIAQHCEAAGGPESAHCINGGTVFQRDVKTISIAAATAAQLEEEKQGDLEQSDLAKAMLAQSQAMAALVTQLAGGDTLNDLTSSSMTISSKGSQGRQKLQQELSAQRGTFFNSVIQAMARRMQPSKPADQSPAELASRGVIPTTYVERYGGYGRKWDLGCLMWQVAILLDHLQSDNYPAAKDAAALLAVCLEQGSLDGGRLDIGLLLSLSEDPPAGVFQNRSVTNFAKGKAFAPLAEQRWVTIALSYIKEMDLIASKRSDATGGKPDKDAAPSNAAPKKVPKKPKGGGKKGGGSGKEEEETAFSFLLAQTFHIQCCGSAPASAVFPLPLADFGLFASSGPKLSLRRWRTLVRKRFLHVLIVAINFLAGVSTGDTLTLLGRRPNLVQRRIHQRLAALVTACDSPEAEEFSLVPGRSGPEFVARMRELEHFAKRNGLLETKGYVSGRKDFEKTHAGVITKEDGVDTAVQPYSSLNAERLRLVGQGKWRLDEWLHDELYLPYLEPMILHHGQRIDHGLGPKFSKEDPEEYRKLAKKWSDLGLLGLTTAAPPQGAFTRIFNARKDEKCDRQIGDRRLANQLECSLQGPSKYLPGGYLLTSLHVPKGCCIHGAITDRKDFYHQSRASPERANSNVLPFSFPQSDFEGTEALEDLRRRFSGAAHRHVTGDRLGKGPRGLLVAEDQVFPTFKSLLQGDHLGVEFALSAHGALLKDVGLLGSDEQILGHHPFPRGPVYQGLVIDDFFCLSVGPCSTPPAKSEAVKRLEIATKQYEREKVLGSPEKDVVGSRHFKAIGAEIDTSDRALSLGVASVGAPVQKRFTLALLTLRVAKLP
eukprot:s1324_g14.t1